jgi:hypothetical protein
MSNFELLVVRPDDLLALRFEFVNLALDTASGQARLMRPDPGQSALMIVHFPPQHVAERSLFEDPFVVSNFPSPPVPSVLADPSRLVFRIPDATPFLPLTLESLLTWSRYEPVVVPNALPEPPGPHNRPPIAPPTPEQTAIEVPYGLILSPDRSGVWAHSRPPVTRDGRAELWHTRLGVPGPRGVDESRLPTLRAVWATHERTFSDVVGSPLAEPVSKDERIAIAKASSDFSLPTPPRPLTATHLILSALGAWADLAGDWPVGDVAAWRHVAVMGRDQYVQVVRRGVLFPFGHRATEITLHQRKFKLSGINERVAYLTQRSVVVVEQQERVYDERDGHDLPFTAVALTEPMTPPLTLVPRGPGLLPHLNGAPFAFPFRATDRQGRAKHFSAPMVFVPLSQLGNIDAVRRDYEGDVDLCRVDLRDQEIAYAPDPGATSPNSTARTSLTTRAIRFAARRATGDTPFRPRMETAEVSIPAVEGFLGAAARAASQVIRYQRVRNDPENPGGYAGGGFSGVAGGVFAMIEGAGQVLDFPARSVGGLAAPTFKITGLSREHGAVPNASELASDTLGRNPLDLLEGKLMGVIELKSVIAGIVSSPDLPDLPKLRVVPGPGRTIAFDWNPRLTSLPKPLEPFGGPPSLQLKGTITGGAGGPAGTEIEGTLANIALSFAGILKANFKSLGFRMASGVPAPGVQARPSVECSAKLADGNPFEFQGDLKFVNQLSKELEKANFGTPAGPSLKLTAEGIIAELTLALPNVALGALSIQNIALSATLGLFFAKPAEIRFGLSSREHPFLVSYSVFGGGGFFSLGAAAREKAISLEAAIEFGGVVALDLVLARGEVQAMVGIYLSIKDDKADLGGYVRLYGCVEVLRVVSISVEFYLRLTFDIAAEVARGTALLTVMVRVLAFSRSVTLEVERSFSTKEVTGGTVLHDLPLHVASPPPRSFEETVSLAQWQEYCQAFA